MKICKFCKSKIYRKPTDQKVNWEKKKFCSRTCSAKYNRALGIGFAKIHNASFRERYGWDRYEL